MTPITRSSARQRTKQKDLSLPTSRSIRNPRAEKNAPANRFLVQSAAPEPAITNTAQEFHQGPVIEWILIKILEDSNPEAKERRKVAQRALLKEIRRQEGCEFVATGKPLKSESEWVIIQWRSRTDRDELIASTKPGRALKELLEQRAVSTNLISRSQGPPLNRSQFFDPPRYYEIMTAYFPANLPQQSQASLNRIEGPLWLPRESGGNEVDEPKTPADGLLTRVCGYSQHEVELHGIPARQLYCFMCWEDEAAEQAYKRELRHFRPTKDTAWEYFIHQLEECQMLEYKVESATLEEIDQF